MNRQNFVLHLTLALMLIGVAAFVGQIRRWQREGGATGFDRAARVEVREEEERVAPETFGDASGVIVRFREGVTEERAEEIIESLNDAVDDEIESVEGMFEVFDRDGLSVEEVLAEYARRPEVEYAEENFRIELDPQIGLGPIVSSDEIEERRASFFEESASSEEAENLPNDPMFGEQWALANRGQRSGRERADIQAALAWARTQGSERVVVAVLDSGVDYTHPDLLENMWLRPDDVPAYEDEHLGTVDDLRGFNAVENMRDPMDDNGHGTHCAGIIGAVGNNGEGVAGVNWKVEIMPLKFMSSSGLGTTKDAIEAINYVVNRKRAGVPVRVISASWGSTRKSRALEDAIRKAGEEGILFIAASGNSTADTDKRPHYPSSYKLDNVVSVAALTRMDELAGFSNFGAKSVHVAAPGAEILSTWLKGNYREASGTSMATPVVSGVAALVLSLEPDISNKELRERLLASVDRLDSLSGRIMSGGRINAARALDSN